MIETCKRYSVVLRTDPATGDLVVGKAGVKADEPTQDQDRQSHTCRTARITRVPEKHRRTRNRTQHIANHESLRTTKLHDPVAG
jgi:hypothetical protein